jgi:hypothetical protein
MNLNFLFAKMLWVGGSYRTGDSFVALVEFQLTKQWRLGYSYDFTTSKLAVARTGGSHEISLSYVFQPPSPRKKKPTRRMPCPTF